MTSPKATRRHLSAVLDDGILTEVDFAVYPHAGLKIFYDRLTGDYIVQRRRNKFYGVPKHFSRAELLDLAALIATEDAPVSDEEAADILG